MNEHEPRGYDPKPIDTSLAEFSEDLVELLELLACNTHDVWARERIDNGWTWGKERFDDDKRHPCLVPYESLPESEKDIDRAVVREMLAAIHVLGFEIRRVTRRDST